MKPRTLLYLYAWRVRAHAFQELLAGAGIAIGVALLFAVQIANSSLTGSVEQVFRGITGSAQLEVASGDEHGFDQRLLTAIRGLPDVQVAAPTLQRRAIARGGKASLPVQLVGVDPSLADLGGSLTREFGDEGLLLPAEGVVLPKSIASALGVKARDSLMLMVAGQAHRVRVAATLGADQIGQAAGSPLVIARLPYAQRLAGLEQRITQAYVKVRPGREQVVRSQVLRLADGRVAVGPADALVKRLRGATAANDQSTALFSAISAMVGLLFAFNAMLLTMPDRRRFIAELRLQGFTGRQIVGALSFQAVVLGIQASLVGLVLGDLLSRTVFKSVPAYLAFTFPVGTGRVVSLSAIGIAITAGVIAAMLAAARPLLDLVSKKPLDAPFHEGGEVGEAIDDGLRRCMLLVGLALALIAFIGVTVAPSAAIWGVIGLAFATPLVMPAAFAAVMPLVERFAEKRKGSRLFIAVLNLRGAMTRSVAVAAIAAVAVFGATALNGARSDMVHGLYQGYGDHLRTADIWVTAAGRSLTTDSFRITPLQMSRLRAVPGVSAVRVYQGGMYDIGSRRIWLIARPSGDTEILPPTQLVKGNLAQASERVRGGGWAAVSATLAHDLHLHVGGEVALPTPTGVDHLKVAAVVTNLSWGPGAIILNTSDYRRAWRTTDPSAIEVNLRPGTSSRAGIAAVTGALGSTPALDVQTASTLDAEFQGILRDGLTRLSQISALMIIAAALALAAAMTVTVWQRRQSLAAQKIQGFGQRQLRSVLLLEAALILLLGSAVGLVAGTAGHLLGDRWLRVTTGFPATFALRPVAAVATAVLVVVGSLAIIALPSYVAVRVPPATSFQD